jgi:hypothetical protein
MKHLNMVLALAIALPMLGQTLTVEPFPNPSGSGALQPNWSATPDGGAVLSWIESLKDGSYSLRYAVRRGTAWSDPHTVAEHRRFFRHPAEIPEVITMDAGHWLAHWVEMPNESSDAEYLYVSSSTDGVHWTTPLMAHRDRSPVQHGLASMLGSGNGEASVIWLETPKGEDGPAYLMRTIVDLTGKEVREERLDPDVCSCCPTSVAKTSKGLLIAYRDHTPDDIRDISVIRFEGGKWSQPKNIHADNWQLDACPINAASVAARGDHVVIGWFTGAQDSPKTQVVFSEDGGVNFSKPSVASTGHALGYTSVVLNEDGGATASWLERNADGPTHVLARTISAAGAPGPVAEIASGERQSLGYPRLFRSADGTFIAWGSSKVQTARLQK